MTNVLLPVRRHELETSADAPSLLSPELALVDPDLAAVARMLLPEPVVLERPRPEPQPLRTAPARPPTQSERASAPPSTTTHARRLRLAAVAVTGLAALVAGTLGFALAQDHRAAEQRRALAEASRAALQAQSARQARAARTYTWPAVPGAERYGFEIRRGTAVIFETTRAETVIELPQRVRFAPGRYTWYVTPISENQGAASAAPPVVEGTFQVAPS